MKVESVGKCSFCNEVLSKRAVKEHLEKCEKRLVFNEKGNGANEKYFHLRVEGADSPEFWMDLEIPESFTLLDLDEFLREKWLECCGHLSQFIINGVHYTSDNEITEGNTRNMKIKVEQLFQVGLTFGHEYDFGSTTTLKLKVLSERVGQEKGIKLLARNEMPKYKCACGENAKEVCSCCFEDDRYCCKKCTAKHECGEDCFTPLVNSPRTGTCGYGVQ